MCFPKLLVLGCLLVAAVDAPLWAEDASPPQKLAIVPFKELADVPAGMGEIVALYLTGRFRSCTYQLVERSQILPLLKELQFQEILDHHLQNSLRVKGVDRLLLGEIARCEEAYFIFYRIVDLEGRLFERGALQAKSFDQLLQRVLYQLNDTQERPVDEPTAPSADPFWRQVVCIQCRGFDDPAIGALIEERLLSLEEEGVFSIVQWRTPDFCSFVLRVRTAKKITTLHRALLRQLEDLDCRVVRMTDSQILISPN